MAESDPRSSNFNLNYDFEKLLCDSCREPFSIEKPARLLPCLHSVCDTCLDNISKSDESEKKGEEEEKGEYKKDTGFGVSKDGSKDNEASSTTADGGVKQKCMICGIPFTDKEIIKNPFVDFTHTSKIEADHKDGGPEEEKFTICTSCDESQKVTSFCVECQEWLCDPCVVAHKRVKFTKDHTIRNKLEPGETEEAPDVAPSKRQVFCDTHKTEPLKLFCLTCESLTCRDCQLNEHKDHKYQFIAETIEEQKTSLMSSIKELQDKMKVNEELADKISKKEKDIKKQQLEVFHDVRKVANTITDELIGWCKQLMSFLQGVCNGRLKDLGHKKKEADEFAKKAKHAVAFVEAALKSGNDLSILHAKSLMSKNLTSLQTQNVNVQPSMFELEIKYENDSSFITKNVSKMGFINVNGKSYPQQSSSEKSDNNPLRNLTRENFSQNIADLLNKQPLHVRETYKNYTQDQRKLFLQKLMMQTQMQQPKTSQAQRVAPFNSDAGAIRDLYNTNMNPNPNYPRQVNQVRPSGTYIPENPLLKQRHFQQQQYQQQQQQMRMQGPQIYPGHINQNIRGGYGDQSFPYNQTATSDSVWANQSASHSLKNLAKFCDSGPQVLPSATNNLPMGQGPAGQTQFFGGKVPAGKFDIDPLNLKGKDPNAIQIKQEPRDRDFGQACQFSGDKSTSNVTSSSGTTRPSSSPRLQSPPTNSHTPPSHTPSPSQVDGGSLRTTSSPAIPDLGVMDRDRSELMKGLVNPSGHKFSSYHLHPKHDPSDPSEDYCGVCHNGGDLLCCDRCPKVFHLPCHVPSISSTLSSNEVWTCTMCIPDEELIINNPVFKEFEITNTGKRKAPSGLTDKELRVCERILLELFCLETTTVFHEPVPKSVPNYYKIIQQPMDFGTIKYKLRRGHFNHYELIEDFISDVKLVFRNCFKFNAPTSDIYSVGKSVENFFESLVQHFLPCYMDHLRRRTPSPVNLEANAGDAARNKKRRSPVPDSNYEPGPGPGPVHYS